MITLAKRRLANVKIDGGEKEGNRRLIVLDSYMECWSCHKLVFYGRAEPNEEELHRCEGELQVNHRLRQLLGLKHDATRVTGQSTDD